MKIKSYFSTILFSLLLSVAFAQTAGKLAATSDKPSGKNNAAGATPQMAASSATPASQQTRKPVKASSKLAATSGNKKTANEKH